MRLGDDVLHVKMPLFESFLDVEAGQPAAEPMNVRPVAPVVDPARLRHRAQNSQRFVFGMILRSGV